MIDNILDFIWYLWQKKIVNFPVEYPNLLVFSDQFCSKHLRARSCYFELFETGWKTANKFKSWASGSI